MPESRTPTPAAVLVPVFRDERDELRLVVVVRGEFGLHGGQLGLPGGKHERGDASLLETALRETEEEVGIPRTDIEVIAELEPVDTRTTRFRVGPYLARVRLFGAVSLHVPAEKRGANSLRRPRLAAELDSPERVQECSPTVGGSQGRTTRRNWRRCRSVGPTARASCSSLAAVSTPTSASSGPRFSSQRSYIRCRRSA
jgi:8-oxo-dGTP pyrophosphatase MutT (NUDIX family)